MAKVNPSQLVALSFVVLALVITPRAVLAESIFKCKGADGSMHYQSTKCEATEVSRWGMREAPAPAPTGEKPAYSATLDIPAAQNGVFFSDGTINGTPAKLMIDTGASYVFIPIALSEQLGLDCVGKVPMHSANGTAETCHSKVRSIKFGKFELHDVPVLVSNTPVVLLGQTVLRHFKVEQENEVLRLSMKAK